MHTGEVIAVKLTILGGGGFRVPLVYRALLGDRGAGRVTEVALHDLDARRLETIRRVLADQAARAGSAAETAPPPPRVTATTDADEALRGADFVFSAIRVGGAAGRVADERVALAEGVLGQETVGAGGIAYGLRTVPVARAYAERIARVAPEAWTINFTNPAGLVTEAMAAVLGERVIGICDSPVGLGRRVARALGADPARARLDYAGLNHLGWLQAVELDGRDLLPDLFAQPDAVLSGFEEGALFGPALLRDLRCVPNEYLHYYYYAREAVASVRAADRTRGEFLRAQQDRFYASMSGQEPGAAGAFAAWDAVRREREATYMAENREAAGLGEREEADVESGGYEKVALALMRAIARDEQTVLILNVPNRLPGGGRRIEALDERGVVEVPCAVDAAGPRLLPGRALPAHAAALAAAVKAVDREILHAAESGELAAARRAFALHPLIDSYTTAARLTDAYRSTHPGLAYLR